MHPSLRDRCAASLVRRRTSIAPARSRRDEAETDVQARLAAIRQAAAGHSAEPVDAVLRGGLRHASARVVAAAAHAVRSLVRADLEHDVAAAFDRLLGRAAESDPGCAAKAAVAEALDFIDSTDAAPFLRGVRHHQFEKGWGPPVDTAGPVRSRCGLALVRMRHDGVLQILADLLADDDPHVRATACTAVAFHGDRQGAALLRLRLRVGDEEADVIAACMKALLDLDPAAGLEVAAGLTGPDTPGTTRDGVVLGLGESRREDALPLLVSHVASARTDAAISVGLQAIRNLRLPSGRAFLVATIARSDPRRARLAIAALAAGPRDAELVAAVRAAAAESESSGLAAAVEAAFGGGS